MLPVRLTQPFVEQLLADGVKRSVVIDRLLHRIKDDAPPVEALSFDLPVADHMEFEDLTGLFAGTTLDEYIITMNLRQAGYLFGLIRRAGAKKVIEVGRHWGGTTVLIAAAMAGEGQFWSLGDPRILQRYLDQRGLSLPRSIEAQLSSLDEKLGMRAEIVTGDLTAVEVDTGEVDLVFIDGDHKYESVRSDFERFGMRVRVGGAVLFDDAVVDTFFEPRHTAGVKKFVAELQARPDFRLVKTVRRMAHFERTA